MGLDKTGIPGEIAAAENVKEYISIAKGTVLLIPQKLCRSRYFIPTPVSFSTIGSKSSTSRRQSYVRNNKS